MLCCQDHMSDDYGSVQQEMHVCKDACYLYAVHAVTSLVEKQANDHTKSKGSLDRTGFVPVCEGRFDAEAAWAILPVIS